jgi:hypothetical protein
VFHSFDFVMIPAFSVLLQMAAVTILADFISGILHWIEDSYGSERTPYLGRIVVVPNVIHHYQPREFTSSPFWRRNSVTTVLAAIIYLFGAHCSSACPGSFVPSALSPRFQMNCIAGHIAVPKRTDALSLFSIAITFCKPLLITPFITPIRRTARTASSPTF